MDPLPVFTAGSRFEYLWHATTASPILYGALTDGCGKAVVACDMPEPCKILSLDSCTDRFLWAHKEVNRFTPSVVGLVLKVGDAKK